MQRTVVIGVAAALAAVAIGAAIFLSRPDEEAPAAPAEEVVAEAPAPAPAAPPAPAAEAPRPAAPRRESRPAEPVAEAPAAPAPEPVAVAPDAGTLRISADVPGAQVFLDRQFIGAAPAVAENVKPGTHQLNVSAEGFESIVQTVTVEPGERDLTVRFREVRLDARVEVIHKHRIGSCRGTLIATPRGIRYETTDKDDAFTSPLLDMEEFRVDYLEKNLRIKLKRGKQFNFTDPDGNADRLFVFHRDVDKARERLRKGDQPAGD